MTDKSKLAVISILFCISLLANIWFFCDYVNYKAKQVYLNELIIGWEDFESRYAEDINDIDDFRDKIRQLEYECSEWERIANEFATEKSEWEFKAKDCYTKQFEQKLYGTVDIESMLELADQVDKSRENPFPINRDNIAWMIDKINSTYGFDYEPFDTSNCDSFGNVIDR